MITFKLSHFLVHPIVQRPFHSPTYLCILQYLGQCVGPSLKEYLYPTIFPDLVLSHIGLPPQSKKL